MEHERSITMLTRPPTLDPILSQMHSFHVLRPNFLNLNFTVIFPSTSWLSKQSLSFRFSNQNPAWTQPSHTPQLTTVVTCRKRVQITKLLITHFFPPLVISTPLGLHIFFSALFSNTTSLCLSLNVRYHASHPYIYIYIYIYIYKQDNIAVPNILILFKYIILSKYSKYFNIIQIF